MKITSAEFKQYSNKLSDDWYFDGDVEIPDSFIEGGASDDEILDISNGDVTLVYQGSDEYKVDTTIDLVTDFMKWRKSQTHSTIVIVVDKTREKIIRDYLKQNGVVVK
jgi:hypothetical protein